MSASARGGGCDRGGRSEDGNKLRKADRGLCADTEGCWRNQDRRNPTKAVESLEN